MAVQSREIEGGRAERAGRAPRIEWMPPPGWAPPELGIALLVFGVPMWLAGARYTVDGTRIAVNLLLAWLGVPYALPTPAWYGMLLLIAVVGWVCSRVEVHSFPIRRIGGTLRFIGIAGFIGWALVGAADLGTTVLGVITPAPDAWPITRWIAATPAATAVVSAVLTFLPEWLILAGWWMLRGRRA